MAKTTLLLLCFFAILSVTYSFTVALPCTTERSCFVSRQMSEEESADTTDAHAASNPDVPCPNCDLCDGSGRIAGGIGAVFPWIPIKAYRPCPNFIEAGGNYRRSGQGLDEIAFGRDSTFEK